MSMDKYFTEHIPAGICTLDTDKVIKDWSKTWSISQWKEEYRIIRRYRTRVYIKVTISKEQAHELIGKMDLRQKRCSIFRNGSTWRKKEHKESDN